MDENFQTVPRKRPSIIGSIFFNLLTFIVLIAILGVGAAAAALFVNPYIDVGFFYNPFPPPTVPARLGQPTATHTPAVPLPDVWTPTPSTTPESTNTPTPVPTDTPAPTPTETPLPPPFALVPGHPVQILNFINDDACDWMGVAGQVFDMNNAGIINLGIHLEGELDGNPISLDTISGSDTTLGPAGYVFNLSDHPIASDGTFWVFLHDGSGNPLSDQVFITTSDECSKNLVLVNWRQVREQ
ncbi:MAG: hypothetical protein IMY80_05680 [Chloroflexi bacterium]|nr:hypothetical protein [Chloroflexota bacterium]